MRKVLMRVIFITLPLWIVVSCQFVCQRQRYYYKSNCLINRKEAFMQQQDHLALVVRSVAVGTTNPAKLAAVDSAIRRIWPTALVTGINVDSGVRAQPLSDEEAICGATNR